MRLFISYARVDKLRVEEISDILRDGGHDPWFDVNLLPGQDWKAVLYEQVRSCEAFVYVLTPASIGSEWCQWEFGEAVRLHKSIIPITLFKDSKTDPIIPQTIGRYQYADFSDGATPGAVARLMGGLTHIAITIPAEDAPDIPMNPDGVPSRVNWDERRQSPNYQTVSQQHLKRTDIRPAQSPPSHHEANTDIDDNIIAIDFGTTNSLCAIIQNGTTSMIPNALGYDHTPSAVGVNVDGAIVVGEAAEKLALKHPERAVLQVKRLFGSDLALEVDGHIYNPAQLASYILHSLKQDAERYLDAPVSQAVITAPAYFNKVQLDSLRSASQMAGLEALRIVAEPTAASLAYGSRPDKNERIVVYDLGGGTFDVSILDVGDGVFEVLAINGDTRLGGVEFDQIIVEYCVELFREQTGIDLAGNLSAEMRIREGVEEAKIILSSAEQSSVSVPYLYGDADGFYNMDIPLSRMRFNELTFHLVERTLNCCKQALADASLKPDDIHRLVFVGLATRTPSVFETISTFFGKQKIAPVDPDRVVVQGAAIQAGILNGKVRDQLLLDVTAQTLAIATADGQAAVLIVRNTTFPIKYLRTFTTTLDNQTHALIPVIQGESEIASENSMIGGVVLRDIPRREKGQAQIEVFLDVDANGVITIIARIKDTAVSRMAVMDAMPVFEQLPGGVNGGLLALIPDDTGPQKVDFSDYGFDE